MAEASSQPSKTSDTTGVVAKPPGNINLDSVARGICVEEAESLANIELRKRLAWAIITLTFVLNIFTIGFLSFLACADHRMIANAVSADPKLAFDKNVGSVRLVTPQVLMSIVGATVVQVGASLFVITQYLFPKSHR